MDVYDQQIQADSNVLLLQGPLMCATYPASGISALALHFPAVHMEPRLLRTQCFWRLVQPTVGKSFRSSTSVNFLTFFSMGYKF